MTEDLHWISYCSIYFPRDGVHLGRNAILAILNLYALVPRQHIALGIPMAKIALWCRRSLCHVGPEYKRISRPIYDSMLSMTVIYMALKINCRHLARVKGESP